MIIIINKKRIDYSLDNEKYLNEIIENLNKWLSESQLIIEKLFINNEDFSNHDLHIALDDINVIEIETLSFVDLNINNISWIKYFFERLILAINNWDTNILSQVKLEIPFVLSHLPSLLSLDNTTPENIYSDKILDYLEVYNHFNCKEEIVDKIEITNHFNTIVILLNERLNEYTNTENELKASIYLLTEFKEEIESVSILLQSGKVDQAALIMDKFTNIFNKVLRIINFNLNKMEITYGKKLDEFTSGLDEILTELLEGYKSQDTVLIGDILEYEINPRIETLKNIFS